MDLTPSNPAPSNLVPSNSVNANTHRRAIGTFPDRSAAEHALHALRDSSFVMERVSVVAKDSDRNDTIAGAEVSDHAENKADEGAKIGAVSGGAVGGFTGLLVGLGALAIPGVGPVMLAGAAATALATTLAGGAIGAATGGLVGGLIGMGIPEERARVYNDRVSKGEYLVIVDGTDAEIHQAEAILSDRGIEEWGVYDIHATEGEADTTVLNRPVEPIHTAAHPIQTKPGTPVGTSRVAKNPTSAANSETVRPYEERLMDDSD